MAAWKGGVWVRNGSVDIKKELRVLPPGPAPTEHAPCVCAPPYQSEETEAYASYELRLREKGASPLG